MSGAPLWNLCALMEQAACLPLPELKQIFKRWTPAVVYIGKVTSFPVKRTQDIQFSRFSFLLNTNETQFIMKSYSNYVHHTTN